jgi:hypothetical protein
MKTQARWFAAILVLLCTSVFSRHPIQAYGDTDAADAPAQKAAVNLTEIRSRAESMPIDRRIDIDKRVAATVERVNKQAEARGQSAMAARLASKLEMSTEALLDEKGKAGFNWGELVIAETLLANSTEAVKLSDLATLRGDGLSWAAIAFGLGFHIEDFEDAVKSQGKIAMGLSKPDAKTSTAEK